MIDHIGLRTAQFDVVAAFYEQALAPLGIKKLMAYDGGAGFGRDAPVLWIGASSEPRSSVHLALSSADQSAVRVFTPQPSRLARRTTARRVRAIMRRTITPLSSSTGTATISRPCAAAREFDHQPSFQAASGEPAMADSRIGSLRDRLPRSAPLLRPLR